MTGGDLDGDYFTVIWEPLLFPKEEYEPMDYEKPVQQPYESIQIPDSFIDFFVQYMATAQLGRIDNAWLALAAKLDAKHPDCLELAQLHSKAVDYPKTGLGSKIRFMIKCQRALVDLPFFRDILA
jgi:RNA-dependent RNA polymerase